MPAGVGCRHLDESQRAMAAARVATLRREDTLKQNQRPDGSIDLSTASKMLNVGEASIKRARVVLKEADPEIIKLVEDGKLAVSGRPIGRFADARGRGEAVPSKYRGRQSGMTDLR
jgi:hypothetical protein